MKQAEHHPERALQAWLEAALAGTEAKRTVIGRLVDGRRIYAAVGCGSEPPEASPFRTGCTTKLLVAALVERTLRARGLGCDERVRELLGIACREPLGETSIRHLLEHTHGLDDSDVPAAPRRVDGRIDLDRLLALLAGRRFAAPGQLYFYSSAGAYLLAAVLEKMNGRPIEEQVRDVLLAPLGVSPGATCVPSGAGPRGAEFCPATGGRLELGVRDLLTFLETSAPSTAGALTPLPGWHPLERGIRLGWKCYAGGWLGHQSVWPGASLLLCVEPATRSALVVAAEGAAAAVIAAKVLGRELHDLLRPSLPARSPACAAPVDPGPYCARYRSAAETLEVERAGEGLLLRSDREGATRLIPASGHIFFLEHAGASRSFVQLIERSRNGFEWLWDGRRVFPRAASSSPDSRRDRGDRPTKVEPAERST